jgi:glycosyltransferase involved in cell wall biosynthesis
MVVHAHYPIGEPRVQREARAALDAGYDVEVVCLRGEGEPAREVVEGVAVRRLPLAHVRGAGVLRLVFEYVAFALLAAAAVGLRRRPPGAVHVHTPPDFLVVAALPAKLRGARVLLDIHDLSPHMWEARFGPGLKRRLVVGALRLAERAACRIADAVVTVHEPYGRELAADGVDARKISIVMNSTDDALVARALDGAPAAPEDGAFTVAYHGTITAWYGVDLVVDAIALLAERLPDVRGVVLGAGDALDGARALAAERGVADRIAFSGTYLPIEEALRRVAGASCGAIPNRPTTLNRFALSSKLFEYVALGIPAVVARLDTLAAHFSDDEMTFFEPGDAGSLAGALEWVARNPEEAAAKVERAARRAESYSWHRNRDRYLRVLAGAPSAA